MPHRELEDWERCDKSPFTGTHAWARDGLCGFCYQKPQPGEAKERVTNALRQFAAEEQALRAPAGKLRLK